MSPIDGLLFSACKVGNLPIIKCLVLHFNVSVKQRDRKYLYPIYYACKCGHKDAVKFLISTGGADIGMNNITKCYLVSCPSIKALLTDLSCNEQYYHSPFLKNFNNYYLTIEKSKYDDIITFLIFENPKEAYQLASIQVHSFVLEARCPEFFRSHCRYRGLRFIEVFSFNDFRPNHFRMIIKYLYFGTLFIASRSMLKFLIRVCSYLQLDTLKNKLKSNSVAFSKQKRISDYYLDFSGNYQDYFKSEILEKIINLNELNLLYFCYPTESMHVKIINRVLFDYPFSTIDCLLHVENQLIPCHQTVLRSQSPYFKQLFTSDFYEARINKSCLEKSYTLPIFSIDYFSYEAVLDIVRFLYTGNCEIKYDRLVECLKASDYYLIEELRELISIKMTLPSFDTLQFVSN